MRDSISVVIPAYNEEENITGTLKIVDGIVKKIVGDYEIIVVNDGSSDNTFKIAKFEASKNAKVKVINHKRNIGMGGAFKSGIRAASKKYITGFPADCDFSLSFFRNLLLSRGKASFVSSYMTNMQERAWIRKVLSTFYIQFMNFLFKMNLKYFNGYFICKLELVKNVKVKSNGFTFLAELRVKLLRDNIDYIEIPFKDRPRRQGKSKALSLKSILGTIYYTLVLIYDVYLK